MDGADAGRCRRARTEVRVMDQLSMWERPLSAPAVTPTMTHQERFEAFHAMNPHVLEALRELAMHALDRGHGRIGIKMLWEVLRWKRMMRTTDPHSEYRLNNNYHSRYARLLMEREPRLAGLFETRKLKTAEAA